MEVSITSEQLTDVGDFVKKNMNKRLAYKNIGNIYNSDVELSNLKKKSYV